MRSASLRFLVTGLVLLAAPAACTLIAEVDRSAIVDDSTDPDPSMGGASAGGSGTGATTGSGGDATDGGAGGMENQAGSGS